MREGGVVFGRTLSRVLRAYYAGVNHPCKLRIWNWFRKASGHARLTVPYGTNAWITVDERDYLQRELFLTGAYEPEVWRVLSAFADKDEVLWDVGAHIGAVSLQAATDPRIREVHAFEPDPAQRRILSLNAALNQRTLRIHELALSDRSEMKQFYHGPISNTGLSSLVERSSQQVFRVQCRAADDLVFSEGVAGPTLLKVDVEGWEPHVVAGARRTLRERPPKAIVFEGACDPEGRLTDNLVTEQLSDLGFRIWWIRRPSGEVQCRENYLGVAGFCLNALTSAQAQLIKDFSVLSPLPG